MNLEHWAQKSNVDLITFNVLFGEMGEDRNMKNGKEEPNVAKCKKHWNRNQIKPWQASKVLIELRVLCIDHGKIKNNDLSFADFIYEWNSAISLLYFHSCYEPSNAVLARSLAHSISCVGFWMPMLCGRDIQTRAYRRLSQISWSQSYEKSTSRCLTFPLIYLIHATYCFINSYTQLL